jgi:hypothetical protein
VAPDRRARRRHLSGPARLGRLSRGRPTHHHGKCRRSRSFSVQLSLTPIGTQLNADIALFRDLDEGNFDHLTGLVSCAFEDETAVAESVPACPHVQEAVLIGAELKHDNLQFKVTYSWPIVPSMLETLTQPVFFLVMISTI